jgi:4-amino-4-deoxy-L-arabinose transferase-like glycosyltransferase
VIAERDAQRLFRPGAVGPGEVRRDLLILLLPAFVMVAAGLGLRDPWPADEPRFALIARDMVASGQWLFPHVGGDWYPDKPPVFFWAIALASELTGSLRVAFLIPSLIASLAVLVLVYDLGRRIWSREAGLGAALVLAFTVQFVMQARVAQIDMTLLGFATASLYGIGRHLLAGPDWRAYALGGFAAGVGVITKGTGFLPLLLLVPFALLQRAGFGRAWEGRGGWRWWLAPVAMLAAIACWLVPMLTAVITSRDPALEAYAREILLGQTVVRYSAAWHHHEPWYFFVLEVIPGLWLPGIALLPWLVPRWRAAWRGRDARPWLFLGWLLLVVLFFSLSPGKRGVYVLIALPAWALAAGPHLPELWRRIGVQRVGFTLAALVAAVAGGVSAYLGWFRPDRLAELAQMYGVTSLGPLIVIAASAFLALVLLRQGRGLFAWAATLTAVVVVQGMWINPMIDGERSARDFIADVMRQVPAGTELGLHAYKEQFLLYVDRPTTNFGHARWREGRAEAEDAARWLNARPNRMLLIESGAKAQCFPDAPAIPVGRSARRQWFLVTAPAGAECAAAGRAAAARIYRPPGT